MEREVTYVPIRIHKAAQTWSSAKLLGVPNRFQPPDHYSLFPTTNQLAKALRSSVLNLLQPLIVNHRNLILNLSHQLIEAASNSSFVGRCGDSDVRDWER